MRTRLRREAARSVLFVQYTNPDHYPTSVYAAKLVASHGFDVTICGVDDWPTVMDSYSPAVQVLRLKLRPRGRIAAPFRFAHFILNVARAARKVKPAVVVGYDSYGLIAAAVVALAVGVPWIYHCYDVADPDERIGALARFLKPAERYFAERAKAVVVPSKSKAEHFKRVSGVQRQCLIVANSPPVQARRSTNKIRDILAERGHQTGRVVYYHGRIGPGKGLEQLIRSMPYWPQDSVLVLLGLTSPGHLDALRQLAAQNAVAERLHYLGVVPVTRLLDYTRSADLGVFVPDQDGSNHQYSGTAVVKLNDYMACGLPYVVSNFPALIELASSSGAGTVADVHDPFAMGQTIAALLNNEAERARMGNRGYGAHLETYNFETQYQPLLELLVAETGMSLLRT